MFLLNSIYINNAQKIQGTLIFNNCRLVHHVSILLQEILQNNQIKKFRFKNANKISVLKISGSLILVVTPSNVQMNLFLFLMFT